MTKINDEFSSEPDRRERWRLRHPDFKYQASTKYKKLVWQRKKRDALRVEQGLPPIRGRVRDSKLPIYKAGEVLKEPKRKKNGEKSHD